MWQGRPYIVRIKLNDEANRKRQIKILQWGNTDNKNAQIAGNVNVLIEPNRTNETE